MTEINNLQTINNQRFKPIGKTDDGKVIVNVKNLADEGYTRYIVPDENIDKFEKATNNFQDKYRPFAENHYSKGNKVLHMTAVAGATLGGAVAAACLKPNAKAMGKFLKVAGGALAGWVTATIVLGAVVLKDVIGYGKTIKKLGAVVEPMLKTQSQNIEPQPNAVEKVDTKEIKEEIKKELAKELQAQKTEETKA